MRGRPDCSHIGVVKFYNHSMVQAVIGICTGRSPMSSTDEFLVLIEWVVHYAVL